LINGSVKRKDVHVKRGWRVGRFGKLGDEVGDLEEEVKS
jgi:hypothetical protein